MFKTIRSTASEEWAKLTQQNPKLLTLDITETPSIVAGFKEIKTTNPKSIDDKLAFKLYDTFGLDEESIEKLAEIFELDFDPKSLQKELEKSKVKSKNQSTFGSNTVYEKLCKMKTAKTDISSLYNCKREKGNYVFDKLKVKLLRIVHDSNLVEKISPDTYCSLIFDKSNLYTEAGGQTSDRGSFIVDDCIFEIVEAQNCEGFVLHKGFLRAGKNYTLQTGDCGVLYVDPEFRVNTMRNHTAVHLLNSALKEIKGASCQKSSKVTDTFLNLDVGIFGQKLTLDEMSKIEQKISDLIGQNLAVSIREIDGRELSHLDYVTLIPGEVYPDEGIRLVEVKGSEGFLSRYSNL